ncbi:MAG: GNAT family N-acetyltransferase [Flavobacteriales bacterium]|nr:GNAT family N-acetyltransferase [Flavobacteriales bacterium]
MRIIDYAPRYQADRKRINVAWIAERFVVEDVDLEVLDHPDENILSKGGHIILAMEGDEVVGTCALLLHAPGVYQMVKMAVDTRSRGKGIGRALGLAIIEKARQQGARMVMLYSNRAGAMEAIDLYLRLGFMELPLPTKAYARADIYMELELS